MSEVIRPKENTNTEKLKSLVNDLLKLPEGKSRNNKRLEIRHEVWSHIEIATEKSVVVANGECTFPCRDYIIKVDVIKDAYSFNKVEILKNEKTLAQLFPDVCNEAPIDGVLK